MSILKSLESLLLILLLIATVCKHFVDASVIQANGVPSPFLEFALHSITDLGLTNSNWKFLSGDYNGDGVVDMYCIKQQGVSSTEVHILDGASSFKSYLLHAGSGLHVSNSKDFDFALGDYNKDGNLDLWAVRKTASTTEIHILNGATLFSNFLLHTTTALHPTNENWVFAVTDFNADGKMDLVCVDMRGAIGTEVHILDGASGFKAFNLHARTPIGFASSDTWAFLVSDYNGDKKPDIYGILKNGATGRTELHVLDGAKSFNSFLVQYPTVLHPTGSEHLERENYSQRK
jgi:FG-GAP-like repeat